MQTLDSPQQIDDVTIRSDDQEKSALLPRNMQQQERIKFIQWLFSKGYAIHGQRRWRKSWSAKESEKENKIKEHDLLSFHLYGVLQSLMKMHPLFDQAMVQLLQRDKNAMIILLRNPKQFHWQLMLQMRLKRVIRSFIRQQRLESASESEEVLLKMEEDLYSRIIFINPLAHRYYAKVICYLDVVLDPFPFGGGVTMCDAIAGGCEFSNKRLMSIPFVTSGKLQTVHHIAAGFAQVLNGSVNKSATAAWYAVDSDKHVNATHCQGQKSVAEIEITSNDGPLIDLIHGHHSILIDSYVLHAIETAQQSREKILNVVERETNELNASKAYIEIYERVEEVALEWKELFHRAIKMFEN
jgi:hypothetical protein